MQAITRHTLYSSGYTAICQIRTDFKTKTVRRFAANDPARTSGVTRSQIRQTAAEHDTASLTVGVTVQPVYTLLLDAISVMIDKREH